MRIAHRYMALFTGRTASQPSISDSAVSRPYYTVTTVTTLRGSLARQPHFFKRSKLIAAFILAMLKQKYLAGNIG